MGQPPMAGQLDARASDGMAVEPEEQARADMYALLARMLHAAPDADMLAGLATADAIVAGQSGHPLDRAWEQAARVRAGRD